MKKRLLLILLALAVSGAMGVTAYGASGNDGKAEETAEREKRQSNAVTTVNIQAEETYMEHREESAVYKPSYEEYEPFGLAFDREKNELYYNGELVRFFIDGVDIGDGQAVRCDFYNEKGVIDVHTLREPIQNPDGSIDPFGKLTGLEKDSREEFENKAFGVSFDAGGAADFVCTVEVSCCEVGEGEQGTSFKDIFDRYGEYGIEYVEREGRSGYGNVYFKGQAVRTFVDLAPDGGVFTFQSADGGDIDVKTVYGDNGCEGVEVRAYF